MARTRRPGKAEILAELSVHGLLLVQDKLLPSVCTLMAGEPIRGSWWGHPEGNRIFHTLGELDEHPDILWSKLISGKVTLVHRDLWSAFLGVAEAREGWQVEGLSPGARSMLAALDEAGGLAVQGFEVPAGERPASAAKQLEERLLAYSFQEHADGGKHVKVLWTWPRWRKEAGARVRRLSATRGREVLEDRLAALREQTGGRGRLPWPNRSSASRRPPGRAGS